MENSSIMTGYSFLPRRRLRMRKVLAGFSAVVLVFFTHFSVEAASIPRDEFFELFNKHGSIMLIIDAETGAIEYANNAAAEFYGYTQAELEAMAIQNINMLSAAEVAREREAAALEKRNHFFFRHRLASGEVRSVEVYSYPYQFEGRRLLFSIINDITTETVLQESLRRRNTVFLTSLFVVIFILSVLLAVLMKSRERNKAIVRELAENERKYKTLLANLPGMVYRCKNDSDWTMEYVSLGCLELTGFRPEELVSNEKISFKNLIKAEYRQVLWEKWQDVIKEKTIFQEEYPIITAGGEQKWVWERGRGIYTEDGTELLALEGYIADISEKKEKQKRIEFLSYQDHLTGLYNRRFFEEELRRLDTARNLPLTVVMADVNGLKIVNDAFGHAAGDLLLETVAKILKREARADDIIARMGGDEFLLLLPKTDSSAAGKMIKRIKAVTDNQKVMYLDVSVSFGWATKVEKETDIAEIMKRAEDFMYQKKLFESSSRRSDAVKSILKALHIKNPREEEHSKRVSKLCEALGRAYDLSEEEINVFRAAGELHDIGKIIIDEVILNKADKLSAAEWEVIKRHPEAGLRLLTSAFEFEPIAEFAYAHHERWDGAGYPRGLKGEDILWEARVMAIADAYDAMTCVRPYRPALSEEEAVNEIKSNAGTQFDPIIAKVFVEKVLGKEW
jgi:diguanylate cyclase (GGDEF)-like protein/PAS domain S-box-containing protein